MIRMDQMKWVKRALGVLLAATITASGTHSAPPANAPAMPDSGTTTATPAPTPTRLNLLDVVRPEFHEVVLKCVRHPTVATKATGDEIVCTVDVYQWLYDHPDRVALAWQRLKVPTVNITDLGEGKFGWSDNNGSEVIWQTVGTFPDGRVWYASGKVRPALAAPYVPIQATFIVSHPRKAEKDGVAVFVPSVQVYVHSDSKAANLALKLIGPTAPRLAEDAAGQLLEFFGGIGTVVQRYPTKADLLLGPPKKP
ncbi:MAG TPA: hypothetical protein VG097_05370 [Gemmata sp.]|nr:hypothetical protein [Gemmata sp.]